MKSQLESEKNIKLVLRKLDTPVRKKPRPPKLTASGPKNITKPSRAINVKYKIRIFFGISIHKLLFA